MFLEVRDKLPHLNRSGYYYTKGAKRKYVINIKFIENLVFYDYFKESYILPERIRGSNRKVQTQ